MTTNQSPIAEVDRPSLLVSGAGTPSQRRTTALTLGGFALVYAVFQLVAAATGSLYGEAGALICGVVLVTVIAVERALFGMPLGQLPEALGFRRPAGSGLLGAIAISCLLLLYYPIVAWATGSTLGLREGWAGLALGLVLQGGIAEEVMWRGYLFRRLRDGRSFWRAASLTTLVMAALHLPLFATLPVAVAFAAMLVSLVISVPLCYLFEIDDGAVWAPSLVHAVVQGSIKLVIFPTALVLPTQIGWMLMCIVAPLLALRIPRPAGRSA